MEHNREVLISGAGIAGPALAYWLCRHGGFTPTLVERAPAPRTGGYMIDFWGLGYDVAERMGLRPVLEQDGYRIQEVRLVNGSGRRVAGLNGNAFRAAANGRFISLPRGDLAHRVYELVEGRVETIFSDSVQALDEDADGVRVSFEHAAPRRFDLVVGADGLHSVVRALAFGDAGRFEAPLGYYTAAFVAEHYPYRDNAYVSYTVPGRQIARYALRGDRSAFFMVFREDVASGAGVIGDRDAERALLRRVYGGAGWECDAILAAMDGASDLYFDVVAQVHAPSWSAGDRVVLLGDAAYCPSLLAGEGSAFALAGAYVLAWTLSASPGDQAGALAEYESRFRPFVERKQRAARRLGGWFAPRTALGLRLRNVGTWLAGAPLVGRLAVGRAFGDRFELPS